MTFLFRINYLWYMKVAIVCVAKRENKYINEWVEHHLSIGFDNIIICDNNDTGTEKISDVVNNDKVIILDYANVPRIQPLAYTECYFKFRNDYDWIAFIDCDEFIMLDTKYNDIKQFLSEEPFASSDVVKLCWKIFTDCEKLDVENGDYSIVNRFKDKIPIDDKMSKSIINTRLECKEGKIRGHGYDEANGEKVYTVNSSGIRCGNGGSSCLKNSYENAWINHYPTKTIGEFIRQKYIRGGPNGNDCKYASLSYFFMFNKKTKEKEDYANKLINEISRRN